MGIENQICCKSNVLVANCREFQQRKVSLFNLLLRQRILFYCLNNDMKMNAIVPAKSQQDHRVELVQFMTAKSGLHTLGTAYSPASSQYVNVSSLSWKIVIVTSFVV